MSNILKATTSEAYNLMHQGTLALARAERTGLRVDMEYCKKKKIILTKKINHLENEFFETNFYKRWNHVFKEKVDIQSNTQLSTYLYKVMKLTTSYETKSGQGATDENALQQLNIPELNLLLQIRKLKKMRDTYLEGFIREQVDGVIHPSFNLHLVKTFRSSSDRPNFQNMPKRDKEAMDIVRSCIYPLKGHQMLEADFSGVEFRIAGCYYKDPTMLKYINDPKSDIHGDIASKAFMIKNFSKAEHGYFRSAAKNGFVFPELYGSWYKSCASNLMFEWGKVPKTSKFKPDLGVKIEESCMSNYMMKKGFTHFEQYEEHIKSVESYFWNDIFKTGKDYQNSLFKEYQKVGYVESYTGFRFYGPMSLNNVLNYPIQGAAFHCLLWSLINVDKFIRENNLNSRIIGQIHDSLVMSIDPNERDYLLPIIRRIMTQDIRKVWDWIITPLDIEMEITPVDHNWTFMKKINF